MVERKLRPAPSQLISLASRKAARASKNGGRPSPTTTRLFVLDTNVLMHDPTSLFRFEEHDIYLPILVLEELDNNKKGVTEVARNARQASRFLDELVTTTRARAATGSPAGSRWSRSPTARPPGGCTCRPRRSRRPCPRRSRTARPTTRSSPS